MIDFSKMTPEFYEEIQNRRKAINNFKKKVALRRFDDDYDEADEEDLLKMTETVNKMSERLKKYEI